MSITNPSYDLLDQLAEEFAELLRRGKRPSTEEYAEKHPQFADAIRELFPAIAEIEQLPRHRPPHAPADLFAPEQLPECFGEFRIVTEIGRGGMGVVYEAVQETLGRHVALKILAAAGQQSETHRKRFQREAQSAARLHHTNIVPVFAVGEENGIPYFAMQHIRGRGLNDILQALRQRSGSNGEAQAADEMTSRLAEQLLSGTFAPGGDSVPSERVTISRVRQSETVSSVQSQTDEIVAPPPIDLSKPLPTVRKDSYFCAVARIGIQVADALSYAHGQGILHRDIKPSNLHLDTQGAVWVMDFGLAKSEGLSDLTETGDIVGTLRYMPPERFHGNVDARSDLYSLGLTLYELLGLRPAFDAVERAALVQQTMRAECIPLRQINSAIPRDLETICQKLIRKEPHSRYATAAELADDLRAYTEGRPIRARRIGLIERFTKWIKRHPALAASLVLGVFAIAASVGFAVWYFESKKLDRAYKAEQAAKSRVETQRGRAEKAERFAKRTLANSQVLLAYNQWRDDDAPAAKRLLDACPKKYRRWEWHYLQRLFGSELHWTHATKFDPTCVSLSADGRYLAWGERDLVKVVDVKSGKELLSEKVARSSVLNVTLSEDGKLVAAASGEIVKVWDVRGKSMVQSLTVGPRIGVAGLTFSRNGDYLAAGTMTGIASVVVWNVSTGQVVHRWRLPGVGCYNGIALRDHLLAFAAGERAGRFKIRVYDMRTGAKLHELSGHNVTIEALRFSSDLNRLASADAKTVRIWDVETGKPLQTIRQPQGRFGLRLSFNPKLSRIAATDNRMIKVFDTQNGTLLFALKGHKEVVSNVAYGPDGKQLASASYDNSVRLWSGDKTPPSRSFPVGKSSLGMALTPDGEQVFVANANGVASFEIRTGAKRLAAERRDAKGAFHVAYDPSGRYFAAGFRSARQDPKTGKFPSDVRLWNAKTGKLLHSFPTMRDWICGVAIDASGKRLFALDSKALKVWHIARRSELHNVPIDSARVLAVDPIGKRIAVGCLGNLEIRDAASLKILRTYDDFVGEGLAYSADGKRMAYGMLNGRIKIVNAESGELLTQIEDHVFRVTHMAFSPDGDRLASSYAGVPRIKLWDTVTGQMVLSLRGEVGRIAAVTFHPNGRSLLAVHESGRLQVWIAK